ncbi:MAG: hypothetical protein Q7S25_00425 [Candidatus Limnocylindria bacterium]|nr:hypothetical protein [Candidatus Limnocylindria bacterium]
MAKLVQIRQVPEQVHRTLKARAAQSGTSLSEYLRAELARLAALPTPEEILARLHGRSPVTGGEDPAAIIRKLREGGG